MADSAIEPKRLDIHIAFLPQSGGSVQYGIRPVLIVQNNKGNANSSTVIVAPITKQHKHKLPTHVKINPDTGVTSPSIVLCEQLQTIDKMMLRRKIGRIRKAGDINKINQALCVSLELIKEEVMNENDSNTMQKQHQHML